MNEGNLRIVITMLVLAGVAGIASAGEDYVFETSTGHRYSGSLTTDPGNPEMILIAQDTGEVDVPAVEIVALSPFKTKFQLPASYRPGAEPG